MKLFVVELKVMLARPLRIAELKSPVPVIASAVPDSCVTAPLSLTIARVPPVVILPRRITLGSLPDALSPVAILTFVPVAEMTPDRLFFTTVCPTAAGSAMSPADMRLKAFAIDKFPVCTIFPDVIVWASADRACVVPRSRFPPVARTVSAPPAVVVPRWSPPPVLVALRFPAEVAVPSARPPVLSAMVTALPFKLTAPTKLFPVLSTVIP